MTIEYQVTLTCVDNTYKPVSAIVKREQKSKTMNLLNFPAEKQKIIDEGIAKICGQRGWTTAELKEFGYVNGRARKYDREKVKAENAARYEEIKREKFASGEWKPTKKQRAELAASEV